jgi:ubiquitin-conjugating enzyme E2 D/E
VSIDFRDSYPFKCPKIKFMTKVYHPNIKQDTGEICAQAIENNWVPTQNAKFLIETLITLLTTPNADTPLEAEIAQEFSSNKEVFEAKAREFTEAHAHGE